MASLVTIASLAFGILIKNGVGTSRLPMNRGTVVTVYVMDGWTIMMIKIDWELLASNYIFFGWYYSPLDRRWIRSLFNQWTPFRTMKSHRNAVRKKYGA